LCEISLLVLVNDKKYLRKQASLRRILPLCKHFFYLGTFSYRQIWVVWVTLSETSQRHSLHDYRGRIFCRVRPWTNFS